MQPPENAPGSKFLEKDSEKRQEAAVGKQERGEWRECQVCRQQSQLVPGLRHKGRRRAVGLFIQRPDNNNINTTIYDDQRDQLSMTTEQR